MDVIHNTVRVSDKAANLDKTRWQDPLSDMFHSTVLIWYGDGQYNKKY